MANPITWQNVQRRSTAGTAALFEGARKGISEGLGAITNVLDRERQQSIANQKRDVEEGTQSFLDKIASFQTPEELQSAISSGDLGKFRASLGENIDPVRARDAAINQLTTLRQRKGATQLFEDTQSKRNLRGVLDQMQQLNLSTDPDATKERDKLFQANKSVLAELGESAAVQAGFSIQDRKELEQARADATFKRVETERKDTTEYKRIVKAEVEAGGPARDVINRVNAATAHLDPSVTFDMGGTANEEWEKRYDLTRDEREKLDYEAGQLDQTAAGAIAQSALTTQYAREDNPVDPQLSFFAKDKVKVSAAVDEAVKRGYDQGWWGNTTGLKDRVNDAKQFLFTEHPDAMTDPYLGAVMVEAVQRMGTPIQGVVSDPDLSVAEFGRELIQTYEDYIATTANRDKVRVAEATHAEVVTKQNKLAEQKKRALFDSARRAARGAAELLNLQK